MISLYTYSEIGQPARAGFRRAGWSCRKLLIAVGLSLVMGQAVAAPIVVTQQPWGSDQDITNMTNVFGAGNFTAYTSFAAASAASVFSASNDFVMLEGGNGTDTSLVSYLSTNGAAIAAWVNAGGALLIQSAGWNVDISFNGVTLDFALDYSTANNCGTLTAAGTAAFTTASNQCGNDLAHDVVLGAGLTSFMTGDENGGSLVAGSQVGLGYIMYSGLTNSQWHSSGPSLVDSVIRYTALQANQNAVPEPASLALLGIGLAGLGAMRRRKMA